MGGRALLNLVEQSIGVRLGSIGYKGGSGLERMIADSQTLARELKALGRIAKR